MKLPSPLSSAPTHPSRHFAIQVSTVLLAMAVGSLLLFFPIHWYNERHFDSRRDTLLVTLLFGFFPFTSISGTVAALLLLLKQRRWQFLAELLLGAALLVVLSSLEAP